MEPRPVERQSRSVEVRARGGFRFPGASASLELSGTSLGAARYLTEGVLPLCRPRRRLLRHQPASPLQKKKKKKARPGDTRTNSHSRKLFQSFLHSFPVMEGFCAPLPLRGSAGSVEGNCQPLFIPAISGKILQSRKRGLEPDFSTVT